MRLIGYFPWFEIGGEREGNGVPEAKRVELVATGNQNIK
jgi:hypothetical protein